MHQLHIKSLCPKNKTNKTWMSHKNITQRIFTANQCDFCCCLLETSSQMRGFTLASATLISFLQQSLFLFFIFMSTILEKDCLHRYVVTNGMSISRAFLAIRGYGTIWWHQNVESIVVLKSCCWTWLCWSSMISSRYSSLTFVVATLNVNGCLTHAGYDSLVGQYPSRDFASSSKCMAIACFSSPDTEKSLIPNSSSILLTQLFSRGKFAKLSFSVRRFHNGSFFEKHSGFLMLWCCWLHPPASVDWDDWEQQRYRPCTPKWEWTQNFGSNLHDNVGALAKTGLFPQVWQKHNSAPFPRITTEC